MLRWDFLSRHPVAQCNREGGVRTRPPGPFGVQGLEDLQIPDPSLYSHAPVMAGLTWRQPGSLACMTSSHCHLLARSISKIGYLGAGEEPRDPREPPGRKLPPRPPGARGPSWLGVRVIGRGFSSNLSSCRFLPGAANMKQSLQALRHGTQVSCCSIVRMIGKLAI